MASRWWGGLTDQISSMAKDVLSEGTEEIDDHATAFQIEQKKTAELTAQYAAIKGENESLRSKVSELNDSLHSADLQMSTVSSEYKSLLSDKEEELKGLKRTVEELNESNKSLMSSSRASIPADHSHYQHFNQPAQTNGALFEEHEDITDVLSHQHEINRLNSDLERSRAECLHWKRECKRASTPQQQETEGADTADKQRFQQRIQELEARLRAETEKREHELSVIEGNRTEAISNLKQAHAEQIEELRRQLAEVTSTSNQHGSQEHDEKTSNLQRTIRKLEVEGAELLRKLEEREAELSEAKQTITEYARKIKSNAADFSDWSLQRDKDKMAAGLVELEASRNEAETSRKEVEASRKEAETSRKEVDSSRNEAETSRNEAETSRKEAETSRKEAETSRNEAETSRNEAETSRKEAEISRNEVEAYRKQVDELTSENSTLNESLMDLDRDHEVIVGQLIQQRDELKLQNQSLTDEVQSLSLMEASAPLDDGASEISELKSKLEGASYALNELHMGKAEVDKELHTLKAKFKVLADKYRELNRQHKETAATLETSNSELFSLRSSAAESVDHQTSPHVAPAGLADPQEVQKLEEDKRHLQAEVAECRNEITELGKRLAENDELETKLEQMQELVNQSTARNEALSNSLSQSKSRNEEMTDKLNQSQLEEEENLTAMQQSLDASNSVISTMKSKLDERNRECDGLVAQLSHKEADCGKLTAELQQRSTDLNEKDRHLALLQARLDEQTDISNRLTESRSEEESGAGKLRDQLVLKAKEAEDLKARSAELQSQLSADQASLSTFQNQCEELQMEASKSVEQNNKMAHDLSFKNSEVERLKDELEKASSKHHHQHHLSQTLEMELGQKSSQVEQAALELTQKTELVTELSGQVQDLLAQVSQKNLEIEELDSELGVKTEELLRLSEKAKLDTTASSGSMTERSIDSEPAYAEPGEEDMTSPRDSNTSITEVQDLKSQLAELQEILAQKVLLINELKGETDEVIEDSTNVHQTKPPIGTDLHAPLIAQLEQTKREVEQSEARLALLTQENTELASKGQADRESITNLNSQLNQVKLEMAEVQNEKSQLLSKNNNSSETIDGLTVQLERINGEFQTKAESYNSVAIKLDELSHEISQKEIQLAELDKEKSELFMKTQRDANFIQELTNQLSQVSEEIKLKNVQFDALNREKVELLSTSQSDADSISTELGRARQDLHELTLQNTSLSQKNNDLLSKCETDAQAISNLNSELDQLRREHEQTDLQLDKLHKDSEEILSTNRRDAETISKLTGQLNQEKHDLERNKQELARAGHELEETSNKLEQVQLEFDQGRLELDQSRLELDQSRLELEQARLELDSIVLEKDKLEAEVVTDAEAGKALNARLAELGSELDESGGRIAELTQEKAALLTQREADESTITALNSTLSQRSLAGANGPVDREKPSFTPYTDTSSLESQVRSLEIEREQMSGVLSEKSREISNLKKQLHSLMDLNTSRDAKDMETAEMSKQTIRQLSSLIKDKELEVEALTQKNNSLLSILQTTGGANSNSQESVNEMAKLLEEKQVLTQQISAYSVEREQLVAAVQTKHQEAVTFHAEAMRLSALLQQNDSLQAVPTSAESTGELEKLREEYHDRKQQLVETQHKLSEYKQRCSELFTQLEAASRNDNVPKTVYDNLKQEVDVLKSRLDKQKEALLEKDKTFQDIQLRLSSQSETLSLAQTECSALRKQIENLTFELSETRAERDDRQDGFDKCKHQLAQQEEVIKALRSTELDLQRSVKEHEREITQLSSQVSDTNTCTDDERDKLRRAMSALTSERDTAHLTAQQNYQACQDLQTELGNEHDRVVKLEREVDRLRSHLLSIEEGYTGDLLQSEEREKELRNRLATAEEKAAHTSTAVQHASLEASKQIVSLEEQLHSVASQRDSALVQLSTSQEQCTQYSTQLENLQLVLEQFQAEKDSMHAAELHRLSSALAASQAAVVELQTRLSRVQSQLDEQSEALDAAQRLSEQLEKKDEAMFALRDEVSLRESKLREAEERIRTMSTNNEGKVEKLLIKNLVVNYHSTPGAKKPEVLRLIARVLSFTEEELRRVGLGDQPGWMGGIWQRLAHPTSPTRSNPDQSFSELFVKFLETESAPKPAPLPLPVDKMVEEERMRAELHHRPAFNPFVAPTGTSAPSRHQPPHPLLVGVAGDSSPLFPSAQPLGNPLTGQQPSGLSITPVPQPLPSTAVTSRTTPSLEHNVRFIPISTTAPS